MLSCCLGQSIMHVQKSLKLQKYVAWVGVDVEFDLVLNYILSHIYWFLFDILHSIRKRDINLQRVFTNATAIYISSLITQILRQFQTLSIRKVNYFPSLSLSLYFQRCHQSLQGCLQSQTKQMQFDQNSWPSLHQQPRKTMAVPQWVSHLFGIVSLTQLSC